MDPEFIDTLVLKNDTKIIFLIMDGLGGLPMGGRDQTELESARTPNLDALARKSVCGLLDPVGYGITPGSGPAHFALFGYDPIKNNIGRGILEAAGIDFPMTDRDLLIRINFATIDANGIVMDRRAGRIDNETNKRICRKLQENIKKLSDIEIIFEPVREHRALLTLRGDGLREEILETDPQKTGLPRLPVLLSSATCRPDRVDRFGERDCIAGGLGRMPTVYLMGLALAHARRLEKFGA